MAKTTKTEFKERQVARTGMAPLGFNGKKIAFVSGQRGWGEVNRDGDPMKQLRWHDITVYETEGGQYLAHVIYGTTWRGERGWSGIINGGFTLKELCDWLVEFDATERLEGFPKEPRYAKRQARLELWLGDCWEQLIVEIFDALGIVETVE